MNDQRLRLAGATTDKPCVVCEGTGIMLGARCFDCGGTKRTYLFDEETRVPCNVKRADLAPCPDDCPEGEFHIHPGPGHHVDNCRRCQGRGWIPVLDGWERAAVRAGANLIRTWFNRSTQTWWAEVRMVAPHLESSVAEASDPTAARLDALEKAVRQIPGVEMK